MDCARRGVEGSDDDMQIQDHVHAPMAAADTTSVESVFASAIEFVRADNAATQEPQPQPKERGRPRRRSAARAMSYAAAMHAAGSDDDDDSDMGNVNGDDDSDEGAEEGDIDLDFAAPDGIDGSSDEYDEYDGVTDDDDDDDDDADLVPEDGSNMSEVSELSDAALTEDDAELDEMYSDAYEDDDEDGDDASGNLGNVVVDLDAYAERDQRVRRERRKKTPHSAFLDFCHVTAIDSMIDDRVRTDDTAPFSTLGGGGTRDAYLATVRAYGDSGSANDRDVAASVALFFEQHEAALAEVRAANERIERALDLVADVVTWTYRADDAAAEDADDDDDERPLTVDVIGLAPLARGEQCVHVTLLKGCGDGTPPHTVTIHRSNVPLLQAAWFVRNISAVVKAKAVERTLVHIRNHRRRQQRAYKKRQGAAATSSASGDASLGEGGGAAVAFVAQPLSVTKAERALANDEPSANVYELSWRVYCEQLAFLRQQQQQH